MQTAVMWQAQFLADLHVHSNYSDGSMTIPELVDFYGRRKFGAIAITDHICEEQTLFGRAAKYLNVTLTKTNFDEYLEVIDAEAKRAWRQYSMVVIPGFEISKNSLSNHRSAHLLGLGVCEFVSADDDIAQTAREIKKQGALVVAAHPVSTRKFEKQTFHLWSRRQELEPLIDAWEVASGPFIFDEVLRSGLPMLATSDLHRASQINAWKSVFTCERSAEAVLTSIQNQDIGFQFFKDSAQAEVTTPVLRPYRHFYSERHLLGFR
jgi:predicted metal-dependent phosphoesterase TrpH